MKPVETPKKQRLWEAPVHVKRCLRRRQNLSCLSRWLQWPQIKMNKVPSQPVIPTPTVLKVKTQNGKVCGSAHFVKGCSPKADKIPLAGSGGEENESRRRYNCPSRTVRLRRKRTVGSISMGQRKLNQPVSFRRNFGTQSQKRINQLFNGCHRRIRE